MAEAVTIQVDRQGQQFVIVTDENGFAGTRPVVEAVTRQSGSSTVVVGSDSMLVEGSTMRGLAVDKPTAADAHAAIPYATYWSVDTGAIEVTTGTTWVAV